MTPKQVAQNTVQDTLFHSPQNESPLSIQVSQLNAQAGLSDFQEKLSKIELVESALSPAVVDRLAIDSMTSPPSDGFVGVFGQAARAVSRLSTGLILRGADVAAPLLLGSLHGSLEAVAAHYPQQLQELTAIAEQGQQKLQVLTQHVGGMSDRYSSQAAHIEQQWDAVNHSLEGLQGKAQQAKTQVIDIKRDAYRSALQSGAVIGSLYVLSYIASACDWGGSSVQRNLPSVGWVTAGMVGKMIYDCYRSDSFRQLSKVCAEMYSELIQMGRMGFQLSNDLIATSSAVLRDTSILMNEAKNAGLIPSEVVLDSASN